MKKILFVCSGDTCRSPMAKAIFRKRLKEKGIKNISCSSAGIDVQPDETKLSAGAEYALGLLGIRNFRHKARQIQESTISESDYVLTMTLGHKRMLLEKFHNLNNVFCIAEFIQGMDVFDPYGKSKDDYFETARYLDFVTDQILEKLYKKGELKW